MNPMRASQAVRTELAGPPGRVDVDGEALAAHRATVRDSADVLLSAPPPSGAVRRPFGGHVKHLA